MISFTSAVLLLLLGLALAYKAPPHARVNGQCYSVWNAAKTGLNVVWRDAEYEPLWTLADPPSADWHTSGDGMVQRLWCTDSGVVGRHYGPTPHAMVLEYYWLLDETRTVATEPVQSVIETEKANYTLASTNGNGPGGIIVVGSTLYLWNFRRGNSYYSLPRLSAVEFSEYAPQPTATRVLDAFNVVGFEGERVWFAWESVLLYSAGDSAVTLSWCDYDASGKNGGDIVVRRAGSAAERQTMINTNVTSDESLVYPYRQFMTVLGYACHAAKAECRVLPAEGGRYTWRAEAVTHLGTEYEPIATLASFALPVSLWAPSGALAAAGLGTTVVIHGGQFLCLQTVPSSSCATGNSLVRATYDIADHLTLSGAVADVGCQPDVASYENISSSEVPYAVTAVKWSAPQSDALAVYASVGGDDYVRLGSGCPIGEYAKEGSCVPCHVGYYCPGDGEQHQCPTGSSADSPGSQRCAVAPGKYVLNGAVHDCQAGYYCAGGDAAPVACAPNTFNPKSAQSAATACVACAAHSTSAIGSVHCTAEDGYYMRDDDTTAECDAGFWCSDGQRTACPMGTFNKQTGRSLSTDCVPCIPGTISVAEGAASCVVCGTGLFSKSSGSVQCASCNGAKQYTDSQHTKCLKCSDEEVATDDHLGCKVQQADSGMGPGVIAAVVIAVAVVLAVPPAIWFIYRGRTRKHNRLVNESRELSSQ